MPGTIQVSVLEFMDLPFSLPSSSISIKVSMGKREYQTWDKGDFSFPLLSLREKLIVTLQDAEGNEISYTGVETMSVVEKGLWDDNFPLEGGGHVHMKLQFILSEEERNKIRVMRELALKKRHGELLSSSPQHPETASTVGRTAAPLPHSHEVSDSQKSLLQIEAASVGEVATQADPVSNPVNFIKDPQSGIGIKNDSDRSNETTSTIQDIEDQLTEVNSRGLVENTRTQSPPADVPIRPKYAVVSSPLLHRESVVAARSNSIASKLEEDQIHKPEKQGPQEKTPSNVRKMISAFETNLPQDMKPLIKPPMTNSESSKNGMEAPSKKPHLKEVEVESTKRGRSISERRMEAPVELEFTKPRQSISKRGMEAPSKKQHLKEVEMEITKPGRSISEKTVNSNPMREMQQAPTYIREKKELLGSDRALNETKSSQDTMQLKESSEKHIQSKGTISSIKHIFKVEHKRVDTKEERRSSEDFMRTSTVETATVSGRVLDEHWGSHQPFKLFTDKPDSGDTSGTVGSEREIHSKDSHASNAVNIRRASNDNLMSAVFSEDKHYPFESSSTWIFPDEERHLCITTANKQMMDLTGGCSVEAKTHQGMTSFSILEHAEEHSMHCGTNFQENKTEKTFRMMRKSKVPSSAEVEPLRGPLGQVIKIAIMVGFGTLVLLTRQRKKQVKKRIKP